MQFYIENSDEYFLTKTIPTKISSGELEKDVIQEIINRKLFKRVFQSKLVLVDNIEAKAGKIKDIKKQIDKKLKQLEAEKSVYSVSDMFQNNTYKILIRSVSLLQ
jgi:uncharacterized protein